jgi:hypothetical protein
MLVQYTKNNETDFPKYDSHALYLINSSNEVFSILIVWRLTCDGFGTQNLKVLYLLSYWGKEKSCVIFMYSWQMSITTDIYRSMYLFIQISQLIVEQSCRKAAEP